MIHIVRRNTLVNIQKYKYFNHTCWDLTLDGNNIFGSIIFVGKTRGICYFSFSFYNGWHKHRSFSPRFKTCYTYV